MSSLIKQNTEAEKFCEYVFENVEEYKLFENESFKKYISGVLSTTEKDAHGDKMTEEALRSFQKQMSEDVSKSWMFGNHNRTNHPIGRWLDSKVFYSREEDIYFIAGVCGIYDEDDIKSFSRFDLNNLDQLGENDYMPRPEVPQTPIRLGYSPIEVDSLNENEILSNTPQHVETFESARKSVDPDTILTISFSLFLLMKNPFLDGFLNRLGEQSADGLTELLSWCRTKLVQEYPEANEEEDILYEFVTVSENGSCELFFYVSSDIGTTNLISACESLDEACKKAIKLKQSLEDTTPHNITYQYDEEAGEWIPNYVLTEEKGIITDNIKLIKMDRFSGFSFGGEVKKTQEN